MTAGSALVDALAKRCSGTHWHHSVQMSGSTTMINKEAGSWTVDLSRDIVGGALLERLLRTEGLGKRIWAEARVHQHDAGKVSSKMVAYVAEACMLDAGCLEVFAGVDLRFPPRPVGRGAYLLDVLAFCFPRSAVL